MTLIRVYSLISSINIKIYKWKGFHKKGCTKGMSERVYEMDVYSLYRYSKKTREWKGERGCSEEEEGERECREEEEGGGRRRN